MALFNQQKEKLKGILEEIQENGWLCRQEHVDDRVKRLQRRIDEVHRSNLHLLSRLHKRMVERWGRIVRDEDIEYSDTDSDEDEETGPDPRFEDFVRELEESTDELDSDDDDNDDDDLGTYILYVLIFCLQQLL